MFGSMSFDIILFLLRQNCHHFKLPHQMYWFDNFTWFFFSNSCSTFYVNHIRLHFSYSTFDLPTDWKEMWNNNAVSRNESVYRMQREREKFHNLQTNIIRNGCREQKLFISIWLTCIQAKKTSLNINKNIKQWDHVCVQLLCPSDTQAHV